MAIALYFLLFVTYPWQEEAVPYKPANEYEVLIDYKFQDRPSTDRTKVYEAATDEKNRNTISGPLPYLKIQLKLLKLSDEEIKVRIINSSGNLVYSHKVREGAIIKLDIGFIDDVKDHIAPYEFKVVLLSDSKKATSQIRLLIMEDGTFMVNDQKKGKF